MKAYQTLQRANGRDRKLTFVPRPTEYSVLNGWIDDSAGEGPVDYDPNAVDLPDPLVE